ncbi:hypothetical protein [Sphingobacterium chungjuense]|uniref:hypothetical protein n=1 Tax=Sphingobacterium chungjuense TaxID=2675553 RepID=UPI00140E4E75|nr:hypothetical protein [Sphingobacterium chungjuense]
MDLNKKSKRITTGVYKKHYLSPSISVTLITMESAFAAGSIVNIKVEDNNIPYVVEWEERQSEQTWNF